MSLLIKESLAEKAVVEGEKEPRLNVVEMSSVMVARVSMEVPNVSDQSMKRPSHSAPRSSEVPSQLRRWAIGGCLGEPESSRGETSLG